MTRKQWRTLAAEAQQLDLFAAIQLLRKQTGCGLIAACKAARRLRMLPKVRL